MGVAMGVIEQLKQYIDRCVAWVRDVGSPELIAVARETRQRLELVRGFAMRHLRSWFSFFGVVLLFLGFGAVLWNGSVTSLGHTPSSVSQTPISALGWGFAVGGVLILVFLLGLAPFFMLKKKQTDPEPTARQPPLPRVPSAFIEWYLVRVVVTPFVVGVLWWLWIGHPAPRVFVAEVKEFGAAWEASIGMHWTIAIAVLGTLAFAAEWRVWWGAVVLGSLMVFLRGYSAAPVPWPTTPSVSPYESLDPWGAWLVGSFWALCTYVGGGVVSAWGSLSGLAQVVTIAALILFSGRILWIFHTVGKLVGVETDRTKLEGTYKKTLTCFFLFLGIILIVYHLVMERGPEDAFLVPYGRTGFLIAGFPLMLVGLGRYLEKHMKEALYKYYWAPIWFPYKNFFYGSAILVWILGILSLFGLI